MAAEAATSEWPASNVELRDIAALVPYAKNSRTHSPEQIAQIAASMREWGWTNPVLVDEDGMIIAGHGRIEAGRMLGLSQVPVMVARGWSDTQKRAYVIADNQLALNAGWNTEMLGLELKDLAAVDFSMELLGFSELSLGELLAETSEGLTDPDEVPDLPDDPISVPGDVWLLGKHRLVCGDSTDADVVAKCLNGVVPHLLVSDPPYGVNYDADWRNHTGDLRRSARAVGKVENDDRADWREAWALFPGDVLYVWHAGSLGHIVAESLVACGFEIRSQIIWAKNQLIISRGHYHPQHEPCFYAVRKGATGHWSGDRKQTTLWNIPRPIKSETGHSTQKPVECMKRPIENNSSPGQAVYEPFSGSGTTIIAGEMLGRSVHAIELSPAYVDVAVRRWQEFTGQDAKHEATGCSFGELSNGPKRAAANTDDDPGDHRQSRKASAAQTGVAA